jgi:hypothetical protein
VRPTRRLDRAFDLQLNRANVEGGAPPHRRELGDGLGVARPFLPHDDEAPALVRQEVRAAAQAFSAGPLPT